MAHLLQKAFFKHVLVYFDKNIRMERRTRPRRKKGVRCGLYRMKLTMLGTGNALVTEYYNTCFLMEDNGRYFLVDGGGGNQLLHRLKEAGADWKQIRDIFVTHKHLDHIMGIFWMIRLICQSMKQGQYEGEARIYAHDEVIRILTEVSGMLLQKSQTDFIGKRLFLIPVEDGETREIIGHPITFFNIHSTKAKQFGFTMDLSGGRKLTCCGDEPFQECERKYAQGSDWLMHEAFCLKAEADQFHPYEKHHSTAADACQAAEELGVKHLILYHTEEKNRANRRERYMDEGKNYYHGDLRIPEDMETISLDEE